MQPKLDQHEGLSLTRQEPTRGAEEDASKGSGPQAVQQFVQLIPASNLDEIHRKENGKCGNCASHMQSLVLQARSGRTVTSEIAFASEKNISERIADTS